MASHDELLSIFTDDDDTGAAASKRKDTDKSPDPELSLQDELVSIFEEEIAEAKAAKSPAKPSTGKTAAVVSVSSGPAGNQTLIACAGALAMATTESAQGAHSGHTQAPGIGFEYCRLSR